MNLNLPKVYIDKSWGLFIGQFSDNNMHRHYAIQMSLVLEGYIDLRIAEEIGMHRYRSCVISSNTPHRLCSKEINLIILINPASRVGHHLAERCSTSKIVTLDDRLVPLFSLFESYLNKSLTFPIFITKVAEIFNTFTCECEQENHFKDDRIYRAIQHLENNFERIIPIEEVAEVCHLSSTRFLHLFKEKTGINYRRYQLWNRLVKSLPYLGNNTITQTAHQFGFTDSAHYNRTFKETFGLSPKILKSLK
ncbi:MAG: AraC family transcriptional regulator [Sphingobacterium sp.]|jgi:AraC-like DNA-binding protein|nr:AraC family transcriptional regulator [Sphingobacterium sp.]